MREYVRNSAKPINPEDSQREHTVAQDGPAGEHLRRDHGAGNRQRPAERIRIDPCPDRALRKPRILLDIADDVAARIADPLERAQKAFGQIVGQTVQHQRGYRLHAYA
ncbi:MAG: hypothetical protein HND48_07675 [Chloroflexi bacterium]|nr:hypothetical protein [Chloroflexota bacterium]